MRLSRRSGMVVEVWERLGSSPGGPGGVGRPTRRSGRSTRWSGRGRKAHPEVWKAWGPSQRSWTGEEAIPVGRVVSGVPSV